MIKLAILLRKEYLLYRINISQESGQNFKAIIELEMTLDYIQNY